MELKYQRGLSLLWAAVVVGIFALVCMGALFSMRYERNFFAEALGRFTKSDAGKAIQQTQKAAASAVRPDGAAGEIRKCVIDGKVVYSNVECDAKNGSTRKVQLHDTQGFEAPKAPPASASQPESPQTMQDKMIEKATR